MPEKLEYRVEQLESNLSDIRTDVKLIMTNHLPHIETSILELKIDITDMVSAKIDKSVKWLLAGFGILCTIIGLMIKFIP